MKKKFILTQITLFLVLSLVFAPLTQARDSRSSQQTPTSKKNSKRLWDYKRTHFNMYSIGSEIKLGEQVQAQQMKIFQKKKVRIDPPEYAPLKKRIEAIVQRLAKVSDMPFLPYEVHIYDKPDIVNAYCLPGGKIGIYTGIFDAEKGLINPKSDDEIAAVLGHEMAHASLRHVTRRFTTYNGIGLLGNVITLGVSRGAGENWGQMTGQLIDLGSGLYLPSYSRKHEREADQAGFYYLVKAGFDPQAAIQIWQRAEDRRKAKGKKDPDSFFASHPSDGSRANTLRGYLADVEELQRQNKIIEEMKK